MTPAEHRTFARLLAKFLREYGHLPTELDRSDEKVVNRNREPKPEHYAIAAKRLRRNDKKQ